MSVTGEFVLSTFEESNAEALNLALSFELVLSCCSVQLLTRLLHYIIIKAIAAP